MTLQRDSFIKLLTSTQVGLDVESFSNFFCVSVSDFKGTTLTFIYDKYEDHRKELVKLLDKFDADGTEVITFNGIHYDCPVLNYVRCNLQATTQQIKEFSDLVINTEFWWENEIVSEYKNYHKWVDVDLYLYWSKMLRLTKKISLKGLAVQLKYPVIQELPIHHTAEVTDDMRDVVLTYNSVHDINIMKYMMETKFNWQGKLSSFPEMIDLRREAMRKYKFNKKCMSWDATTLGLNVAIKLAGKKEDLPPPLEFSTFSEIISDKIKFTTPVLFDLLEKIKNQKREDKINYTVNYLGAVLDMKEGGLHSSNEPKTYRKKPGYIFHSLDVSGYYPSLAETLQVKMHGPLSNIKNQRIKLKHKGLGKTPQANLLKLSANALVGNFNMEKSAVYCPKSFYTITINGQLFLMMLMEWISYLGVELIMANTDGFECYVPENNYDKFLETCNQWEKYSGFELEHFEYDTIYMLNVNSYLGVFKDGSYKEKGFFVTNPDLGNKVDFLAIPKSVNNYLLHNTPILETFNNLEIYDFCGAQKIGKDYEVFYNGEKLPQRLNVYYVSKNGSYLMKKKNGKLSPDSLGSLKQTRVKVFNEFKKGPYDIDYNYYKKQSLKILDLLSDKQINTLF